MISRAGRFLCVATSVALAACATPPADEEGLPARRADVTAALYRQLELVLVERAQLGTASPRYDERREELSRLADEIALRIVRVDPDVDLEKLQRRLTAPSTATASAAPEDGDRDAGASGAAGERARAGP